jgi:hypothetical protein
MFRRTAAALALVSSLSGCLAPGPGPVVTSGGARGRQNPNTRTVWFDAVYALRADDPPGEPLYECRVPVNGRIGFYRERDGTLVALAPGYKQPLPPGAYRWDVVRDSVEPWRDRVRREFRQDVTETAEFTKLALVVTGIVVLVVGVSGLIYWVQQKGYVGVQLDH